MTHARIIVGIVSLLFPSLLAHALATPPDARDRASDALKDWPQWRGPLGTGVAPYGNPPVEWSESQNIRWKTEIPGKGHSTPVIWGDRIFLTTAAPFGEALPPQSDERPGSHDNVPALQEQRFVVLAVSRRNGRILWQRVVRTEQPHESKHLTGSWASNSPVTDGEHVFAFFGSRGLYALTADGELVWEKDFGDMHSLHGHGEGSSPALHGDTLIVNWDHEGDSFVVALDKRTGKERWKKPRDEITSWSTPLVVEYDGKPQVIIAATKRVRSYDLQTGDLIWECSGLSGNVVASPVAADGFVYVGSSYNFQAMLAIRLADARGDITGTDAIVWTRDRHTPYVPSPMLYGDMLCFLRHLQGIVTCVEAESGTTLFGPQRLPGMDMVYASPVGAADRMYFLSRGGTAVVLRRSKAFELLATNHLDDTFSASPAIAGNELYLRGERFLYCIAEKSP